MTTLQEVRVRFARDQGLPFADSLSEGSILDALHEHGVQYRDRLFSPVTTIWGFLSQVLSDDPSCRDTVARVLAHRAAAGLTPCSPHSTSSCNAGARLPSGVLRTLARRTAQQLQDGLPEGWLWHGRRVFIADGSHVSMPDSEANQAACGWWQKRKRPSRSGAVSTPRRWTPRPGNGSATWCATARRSGSTRGQRPVSGSKSCGC
jgi:hypothetical protein